MKKDNGQALTQRLGDLPALHALLAERSVTGAARRLGVTQSAMSHTLARLREELGDPLLVRAGRGMVPTARAERMAARLGRALGELEAALAEGAAFDATTSERTFTLDSADYAEMILLPPLVRRVTARAPGVDLRMVRSEQSWSALEEGALDLQLRVLGRQETPAGVLGRALLRERFVCLLRRGHPLAEGGMDLGAFAEARHAMIAPRGSPGGPVDEALARQGLRRRVALTVPHFLAVPYAIAASDLVITLPERVARRFAASIEVVVVEPPLALPGFTLSMVWHERHDLDPAHQWLRAQLAAAAAEVDGQPAG